MRCWVSQLRAALLAAHLGSVNSTILSGITVSDWIILRDVPGNSSILFLWPLALSLRVESARADLEQTNKLGVRQPAQHPEDRGPADCQPGGLHFVE